MSKPKFKWWSYVKKVISAYPTMTVCAALDEQEKKEVEAVRAALAAITDPVEREAVELYFFHGKTIAQVTDETGLPREVVNRAQHDLIIEVASELNLIG